LWNTSSPKTATGSWTSATVALAEPFTTVDVGVGYRFNRYDLRLDGRNLGDRRDPVAESEAGDA
jgi:outer membrane receptor protein involved in Fe transport